MSGLCHSERQPHHPAQGLTARHTKVLRISPLIDGVRMSKCLNKQGCLCNPIREGGRCPVLLARLTDCGKGSEGREGGEDRALPAGRGVRVRGQAWGLPEAGNVEQRGTELWKVLVQ